MPCGEWQLSSEPKKKDMPVSLLAAPLLRVPHGAKARNGEQAVRRLAVESSSSASHMKEGFTRYSFSGKFVGVPSSIKNGKRTLSDASVNDSSVARRIGKEWLTFGGSWIPYGMEKEQRNGKRIRELFMTSLLKREAQLYNSRMGDTGLSYTL